MHANFTSGNYLNAADVPQPVVVTIQGVSQKTFEDGERPKFVIALAGVPKPMVLNQTNGNTIVGLYGNETDLWMGNLIEVYATTTNFGGKQVPGLRVRPPQGGTGAQPGVPQPQIVVPQHPAVASQLPVPQQQYVAPAVPQAPLQAPNGGVPLDA